jgi:hypothetical protein
MSDLQGTLPDYFSAIPRLQETAKLLRIPVDELRSHLSNQGIWANADERIPEPLVFDALEREIAAGRPFRPIRLARHR